jgi:hypothetical protein
MGEDDREGLPGEPGEQGTDGGGAGGAGGQGGRGGGYTNGHRRFRDLAFVGIMVAFGVSSVIGWNTIRDNQAREDQRRQAISVQHIIEQNEQDHRSIICILLIEPVDRTPENVQACVDTP